MTLRPEQERALRYLRKRGTEAPAAEILSSVRQALGELEALVDPLAAEAARRRPGEGRWCVQEVVDHLAVSLEPAIGQFRHLLAGESPDGGPVPLSLLSPDPLAAAWEETRTRLKRLHAEFLELLAGAGDDLPRTARAPVHMLIKVETPEGETEAVDWVESLDWKAFALVLKVHTLEHHAQVLGTLATLYPCGAVRRPGPSPRG